MSASLVMTMLPCRRSLWQNTTGLSLPDSADSSADTSDDIAAFVRTALFAHRGVI